jgi:hypothetical protein
MADGTKSTADPNLELGMNFEQWDRDRRGFRTSIEMVTGGVGAEFGAFAGPEVGQNYQDGLGEVRNEPTYVSSNAMHHVSNPPGGGAGKGASAFSTSSPQVYTKGR